MYCNYYNLCIIILLVYWRSGGVKYMRTASLLQSFGNTRCKVDDIFRHTCQKRINLKHSIVNKVLRRERSAEKLHRVIA